MTDVFTVGLTGSTGAGKGEVARLMANRGWQIIDADVIARQVVEVGEPTLTKLTEHFSNDILNADGSLNRRRLAAVAFASPEQTEALNAIVHPAIIEEIRQQLKQAKADGKTVAVIDAPLLFQSGLDAICDCTIGVVATPAIRQQRICERDGLTVEEAQRRMDAQPSDDFYIKHVTYVLGNFGEWGELSQSVQILCEKIEGALV
ncbi:MAG: dephospho-CoA kinase [Clostridia bacterium]|nr:dephospho-CoA kinase [Clostridia bacterium]